MPAGTIALWVFLLAAVGASAWRFWRLFCPMLSAAGARRFDRPWQRIVGVLRAVGLHERLLKLRYGGIVHAMIFAAFFVLATAIVEDFGSGLIPGFSLRPIGGSTWIALLQDIFAVVMLVGVALAAWQRYVIRPPRFRGSNVRDASIIYGLIVIVVASMLMEAALRIAAGESLPTAWRPVSSLLASLLNAWGLGAVQAACGAQVAYWWHVTVILAFLVYIPGSKHRHMFLAAPNVYFRSLAPKGMLGSPDRESAPSAVSKIGQFSWKDMLDLYSCTECGRCQAACPAYAAGLPLSPKLLITDLRDHLIAHATGDPTGPLIGGVIQEATLWACTTCRACMEACPVHIEHVPKLVDMRRHLVEEGRIAARLQEALSNVQRTGNSMGKASRMRARWTKGLPFRIKDARSEPVDLLWFVGDYASYDPRVQPATRKFAEILQTAGVDFGILYDGEQNSGNDVHRVGEEGLFEMLARHNIDLLAGCRFNRIVTTDPHSLIALSQEYRRLGVHYDVVHYSTLLLELLDAGRIRTAPVAGGAVTYHDPCYLGRYGGGFDAPREVIRRAGYELHEMGRCRENSFCCGAGGGRIWSDDAGVSERPSENRIKEALALGGVRFFVVACPKDKVMYSAAVQALGVEDRLEVRDLIELLDASAAPSYDVETRAGKERELVGRGAIAEGTIGCGDAMGG
jgi:Fe-S oxidoreductase